MKQRVIETSFWQDAYISELTAKEKLTFLYLITNVHVNLCGVYQVSDKTIKIDCDITQGELNTMKKKFETDEKFYFIKGWVKIVNYAKYTNYKSKDVEKAVKRELALVPDEVRAYVGSINTPSLQGVGGEVRPATTPISTPLHIESVNNKDIGGVGEEGKIVPTHEMYSLIEDITDEDISQISTKYGADISFVKSKLDDMIMWHGQDPRKNNKSNWKLTLMNWVKRDFEKLKVKHLNNERIDFIDPA